jgi:hypothetical protein
MRLTNVAGPGAGVLSTTDELNDDTRLVLRLLRQWLAGLKSNDTECWQAAWNELAVKIGSSRARRVLVAVERFIRVIGDNAGRSLTFRPVQCGYVGVDEGVMLLLLRRAGGNDEIGAMETAAGIVCSEAASDLVSAARQLHEAVGRGVGEEDAPAPESFIDGGGWLSRERPAPSNSLH